ncbi:lysine--tRNA ligase [Candidatus Shapirobacteria bacterium RIFOXYD1_FULL_38_32]|uniref:Lysine--tRNA ligase n=2 Tax=Candidatus Shapironibacteriota TaxID=1752721 RepID=A0A1F7SRN0_9BACT|nr:MAG: Lysine-tRNA ligase [Candidatus Shapirobacteria bacterium GW2011_GWE1_38_92]OGL56459.1 MAG: lysine--tRNA ligase [Candidatus Shapirobacteria bacterium RIFOXYB1_FULL_38_38]OGL56816.1 MAG: lysine--tRNA ligase [Candidatus Shapirobacteria bacterium RIFOXYA1_FULL_39_17]OGL57234.1 MAG: lysine--tRNA ligase [Candidatus Shapirobacteria bacterium RIFOXYD1_FULL_38_32]OGL57605.1 MAG: lysine--tRNA ligase [Candidatus Shapirobacteria bacterium RIFOXYC1_FULL_38_24]HAP37860.1 lysine--tRNA ligase [Candida
MPTTKLNEVQKQRLLKLQQIKDLQLNPYPQPDLSSKDTVQKALESLGKKVLIAGRILSLRGHGNILFADLHDKTGKIQLFFEQKTLADKMSITKLLDLGDIISAQGEVFATQAGETTIRVSEFQILTKNIRPLPEKWHGLKDIEERYRQRYVDLIVNPDSRKVFQTRTKILSSMRRFLDDHGFMEVETPILQPIYGGASAKPFITHHNTLDMDMYLRISDELYLKRLMVGGFEKVYEVSKDFRNEGVSRFHNPEFTQIEFYWAYVDYEVLMKFTEELINYVLQNVTGSNQVTYQGKILDFTPPFKRLTFRDAIFDKTSIDIDKITTEDQFHQAISQNKIKLDLDGVFGIGAFFDALYKQEIRPHIIDPTYITDYPASMIALAKRKDDDPNKIASFQLLAQGTELLKAYNELNDPKDQHDRWLEEEALSKKGAETAMQMDHDYIRALEYGMPPTAGWGMGIDRFTQFVTDQATIKDVILFPAMRAESEATSSTKISDSKIIIGQVKSIDQHPNADKLIICQVDISASKPLQIITGVRNFKVEDLVAIAMPGAVVPTPDGGTQKIKKTKLRGEITEAMMCSPLEIGVSENHDSIHVLDESLANHIGEDINLYLNK